MALTLFTLTACQQQKQPDTPASEAAPDAKPGLTVNDGVLMLPVIKGNPGVAYFTLANGSDKPARLAAVFVDGAGKAEMHETKGGTMAAVEDVEIAPGKSVRFERGGKHVMLFDLSDTLTAGATAEMTLAFADGDKLSTPLTVEAMGGGN
jgi:copper(I)-binding protein